MPTTKNVIIAQIVSDDGFDKVIRKMWDEGFFSVRNLYRYKTAEQVDEAIEEQKLKILSRGESWFSNSAEEVKFLMNSWGQVQLYNNTGSASKVIEELFDIIAEDSEKNSKR